MLLCYEEFCRDQIPRAATAVDRALAPPLCCGRSLGLDQPTLVGRRRLDPAPRESFGAERMTRVQKLPQKLPGGEGVLQYNN